MFFKGSMRVIGTLISLFFLLVILLKLPFIQEMIARKVSDYVSEKTGTIARVEKVTIDFTGKVVLKQVYIEDKEKDTLIFAEKVKGRIRVMKLLDRSVDLDYAFAENAVLNIKRTSNDPQFNYQFLLDAFKSDSANTQPFEFNLNRADLYTMRMEYDDYFSGVLFSYFLKSANLNIKDLPVSSDKLIVEGAKIDGLIFKLDLISKEARLTEEYRRGTKTGTVDIFLSDLLVSNSRFIYNNHNFPIGEKGFDVNHLTTTVDGSLKGFTMKDDILLLSVKDLDLKNSDGFWVKNLSGTLEMPGDLMNIKVNSFQTQASEFNGHMLLNFPSVKFLSDSTAGIFTSTTFNHDKISLDDVHYFYPELDSNIVDKTKRALIIHGTLKGYLSSFTFTDAYLGLDTFNYFMGNLTCSGLPDIKSASIDADIHKLNLDVPWFLSYVRIPEIENVHLKALSQSRIKGRLKGSLKNLSFAGLATTGVGQVNGTVVINTNKDLKFQGVSGNVHGHDIGLGKLVKGLELFGNLSASAIFNYKDHNLVYLESDVEEIEYNKRALSNLSIVGSLVNNQGRFQFKSAGTYLHADLWLDLNLSKNRYKIVGKLDELNLALLKDELHSTYVGGELNASITASTIDDLNVDVKIVNFRAVNPRSEYRSDSVMVQCSGDSIYKKLLFRTDSIEAVAEGRFLLSELPTLLNPDSLSKEALGGNYISENIEVTVSTGKVSSLLSMFLDEVAINKLHINGNLDFVSKTGALNGFTEHLRYKKYTIEDLTLTTEGELNNFRFNINGEKMGLSNGLYLNSPSVRGETLDNSTSFVLSVFENESNSALGLTGTLTFPGDTISLGVQNLDLKLKGEEWKSEGDARVVYFHKSLAVQNILLSQGAQKIKIHSQDLLGEGALQAQLWNLKLDPILYFTPLKKFEIKGLLSGGLQVNGLFTTPVFDVDCIIDSVAVGKNDAGRLALVVASAGNDRHSLNLSLSGVENNVYVQGYLDKVTQLSEATGSITVDIPKLSLHLFEPFLKDYLFAMHGYMTGKLALKGKALRPDMRGKIAFKERNVIGVHFTESKYVIANQYITFNSNKIILDDIEFRDFEGNEASVDGYILHNYFKDFTIQLSLKAKNFQVMNTEKVNQAGFYGVLFADVTMTLNGPANDLAINLKLITRPKSVINIPLQTSNAEFKTPSYIIFVEGEEKSDTTEDIFHKLPLNLSKYKFTGNLAITNDALINIIVDPVNEDKISARGVGRLEVKVDQENVPELYGSLELREGSYTFTFASLVRKEFVIEKGSRIAWNGDILEGLLSVKASYTTKASRYDLISNYVTALDEELVRSSKRSLPVTVKLNVTGELAEPELSFQIEMPESNDPFLGNIIAQRVNEINNDQQQLQRQVFGLIVLNRFFPEGAGYINAGGNIALEQANQSVSQILNAELNKIAPESIAGFEIDVNIEALVPENPGLAQSLQFKASRQISERITITAGGNVNVGNVPNSGQFLGDYTVVYRLNSSGSVNLKFFSTSYQSYYYYYYDDITTRSGASIQHKKSFNEFKELFK